MTYHAAMIILPSRQAPVVSTMGLLQRQLATSSKHKCFLMVVVESEQIVLVYRVLWRVGESYCKD